MHPNKKQTEFMKVYESCHQSFLRYCSAMAYGKMDVEDLVQDVLLSAYHHFDNITVKEKLLHYLIRAARNRSISVLRKRKRRVELEEQQIQRLQSKGVAPDVLIDIQLLYKAMQSLPEHQRTALILFEINGFSMKEIALIQKTSEASIKMKVSRGRKKLRQLLTDQKPDRNVNMLLNVAKTIVL